MTTRVADQRENFDDDGRGEIDSLAVGDTGDARLVPALGDSWAHATTTRILLAPCGDDGGGSAAGGTRRMCRLVKSPHKAAGTAYFSITEYGVRDCCYDAAQGEPGVRGRVVSSGEEYNSRKKMRAQGS